VFGIRIEASGGLDHFIPLNGSFIEPDMMERTEKIEEEIAEELERFPGKLFFTII